jgi:hypothetical protein
MSNDDMKPGSIRTFQKGNGKAVVLAVGLWAERPSKSGSIHIHITGTEKFHTTVTSEPESQRYHRTLFRDLRRLLIEQNCWPFGDEGSETEAPRPGL